MFDFETLQETFGNDVNESDAGEAFRVATKEDIINILLAESVSFLKGMNLTDSTPLSSVIAVKLANQAEDEDCFGDFVKGKLVALREKRQKSLASDDGQSLADTETAVQGCLQFLRRIQSNVGRSAYFRHQTALRQETAGADMKSFKSDYDGWQNLRLSPSLVEEAVDELYGDLIQAYNFGLMMASKWARTNMASFPFSSARVAEQFVDFESREECWKHLESNRPTAANAKNVLSMI